MKSSHSLYLALASLLLISGCAAPKASIARGADAQVVNESLDAEIDLSRARTDKEQVEESLLDAALELIDSAQEQWAGGERERALEALDQAYAIILNTQMNGDVKLEQQKEDIRFVISKRILEIYTTRFRKVNGKYNDIPLVLNEHVEREIKLFQTRERNFFLESYKRSGRYMPEILKAIREAGLPEDIAWLPLIESGFKVRALSHARALGMWQFIPSTGYKFGLRRNDWLDERMDPHKSTIAAITYLKELHGIFGDWATALAAYNCGEGRVLRVIRSQQVNYLDNFWDIYERLPRETRRYYPRFLATIAIIKDPAKYGFVLGETDKPTPYEVVTIERPVHLKKLAENPGLSFDALSALNPELRQDATPNTVYELKVPAGAKETVLAGINSMPRWSPPKSSYVVHSVRRGETLSAIAHRYRTSIQKISDENRLRSGRHIRVGQKLKIPLRDTT